MTDDRTQQGIVTVGDYLEAWWRHCASRSQIRTCTGPWLMQQQYALSSSIRNRWSLPPLPYLMNPECDIACQGFAPTDPSKARRVRERSQSNGGPLEPHVSHPDSGGFVRSIDSDSKSSTKVQRCWSVLRLWQDFDRLDACCATFQTRLEPLNLCTAPPRSSPNRRPRAAPAADQPNTLHTGEQTPDLTFPTP
jgi:hypothetical protein